MIPDWIRQSNLIEGVNDPAEDERCHKAWKWLLKQKALDEYVISETHRRIMTKHLGKEAGHFRKCFVTVGGRTCPPPSAVPVLHATWLLTWWDAFEPEAIKKAHIQWEAIHPFVDGNGRTGRFIMNYQRAKAGLDPLYIWYDERAAYYDWFKDLK